MGYWAEAWAWANRNRGDFGWWKVAPALAIIAARYLIIGGDVTKDLSTMLPIIVGTFVFCWGFEYVWLLLFRAPVALQAKRNAEMEVLRRKISVLEKQVDEAKPRLSLIISSHLNAASERWITICNLGQRPAFDVRIKPRATEECRLDFLPIPLVRGGERLDITDKVRVSWNSRGTWYEEPRPLSRIAEVLTGKAGLFTRIKTEIEISYMDNGVPMGSRIELSAHKEHEGVAVQVTGQNFQD